MHKKGKTPKTFDNDGRNGGQVLPKTDKNGNPITYKEYDVNPTIKDRRDAKRVVIGSDGSKYYSNDHYETFIEIIKKWAIGNY